MMKHSMITRMISFFLLSCVLLLSLSACVLGVPTPPPEDDPTEEENNESVDLFDFEGQPYYIKYKSNGSLSSCYVSDIIINPDYTEDFTLVIPATCQYGTVTKIDIEGFDHPDTIYNVPCMIANADFEALRDRLAEKAQTEQD